MYQGDAVRRYPGMDCLMFFCFNLTRMKFDRSGSCFAIPILSGGYASIVTLSLPFETSGRMAGWVAECRRV